MMVYQLQLLQRCRREDNTELNVNGTDCDGVIWVELVLHDVQWRGCVIKLTDC
jgi:hypothetical protein